MTEKRGTSSSGLKMILGFGALAIAGLAAFVSVLYVLLALLTIAFFVVALYRPRWIVMFLVVWMPLEPFLLKFAPDAAYVFARYFSEGLIYMLVCVVLFHIVTGNKKWKQTPIDLPFVLFLIVLVASVILNAVPMSVAVLGIRQIIRFVLLFFVVMYLYPSKDVVRQITTVLLVLVVAESVLGLAQALVGGSLDTFLIPSERRFFESIQLTAGVPQFWDPGSRIFATLGRYDLFGTFLSFALLLTIGLLYEPTIRKQYPRMWIVVALGIPALLLTYSRLSWFGFLLGFLFVGIWMMRDRRVFVGFLIFCGIIIAHLLYSGLLVPKLLEERGVRQTVAERFFESFSYDRWRSEYYGIGRLYFMVQTPLVVIPSAPIFGLGPGQYGGGAATALRNTTAYDNLRLPFGVYGSEGSIDNNWFALWGESGTLGIGIYLWMYVTLFFVALRVFYRSKDPFTRGIAAGFAGALIAVALNAFLGTYLEVRTLALYVWLYAGFVVVLGRREKII